MRDVSAIVEAFTHEELAHIVARLAEQSLTTEGLMFDRKHIGLGPDAIATVRKGGPDGNHVTIKMHDPERESGYYVVFDPNYLQDFCYFWDKRRGEWRTTHHEGSPVHSGGYSVGMMVMPEAGLPQPEPSDG